MKHGRPHWGEEANVGAAQAHVQGGGGLAPPLEIEKQKKKVIRANLKLVHLYLATFFCRKYHFLTHFLSWAPI